MKAVVFCGPTIGSDAVCAYLHNADCRPPAAMGDLYAASRDRPSVIALIDGVFVDRPSVWHREILAVLEAGIPVCGAASMGALRAVECKPFGMVGVGKIVEAYGSGRYPPFDDVFEDDDEVAVLHGPAELGSQPLSDAMVDLRESLARAAAAGVIDPTTRDTLAAEVKALPFGERSFAGVVDRATHGLTGPAKEAMAAKLTEHRASQKREDAVALLQALAAAVPSPPNIDWRQERTPEWERFVTSTSSRPVSDEEHKVLQALGRNPTLERQIAHRAVARFIACASGAPDADPESALKTFREDRSLYGRAQLDRWVADNGLDQRTFAQLLQDEALLEAARHGEPPERLAPMILDELRVSGEYPKLRALARGEP
ncbi:MAG: TfuA-like protein [Pseudomonadota bacterium]